MTLSRKIRVLFDIVQEYYWPSMEPVIKAYAADERYELFLKAGPNQKRRFGILLVSRQSEVEQLYLGRGYKITRDDSGFDIVFCGDTLKNPSRYGNALLVNLDHGPCIKTLRYRNLLKQPETQYVVCAEGPYRVKEAPKKVLTSAGQDTETALH